MLTMNYYTDQSTQLMTVLSCRTILTNNISILEQDMADAV